MSKFKQALDKSLKWEGYEITDDPKDNGGLTKVGISLRFLKAESIDINLDGVIDTEDVFALNNPRIIALYRDYFWNKLKLDNINSFTLQSNIFDMGINAGNKTSTLLIQRSCKELGHNITIDGIMGSNTVKAINSCNQYKLNNLFTDKRIKYYQSLNQPRFIKGWINRANDFYKEVG